MNRERKQGETYLAAEITKGDIVMLRLFFNDLRECNGVTQVKDEIIDLRWNARIGVVCHG